VFCCSADVGRSGKTADPMTVTAGKAALTLLGSLIASAPAYADELVQQGVRASRVPQWSSVPVRLSASASSRSIT